MEERLYDLIASVKEGDQMAFSLLCEDYTALIDSMAQRFLESCPDADKDDLLQEARLALYRAAIRFRLDQEGVTFGLYAKICIRNRLISARRKYLTQSKLKTKRNAKDLRVSPDESTAYKRRIVLSEEALSLLSPFEQKVFTLYAKKCSYSEIAHELSKSVKSIDNAIYRIKSKLRRFMQ